MQRSVSHYSRFSQPFTLAILLELALFTALLTYYFFFSKPVIHVENQTVTLTLQQVNTPTPPKPTPPKPVRKVITPPVHQIKLPQPVTPPVPVKSVADAFSQHVSPPPPPDNQQISQSLKDKLLAEYIEKLRQAVQAALIYPIAAKQMGISGKVRVQFSLDTSQHARNSTVLDSSGTGMFDRYAIKAVNDAIYPSPPKEINSNNNYQIWVEFKN